MCGICGVFGMDGPVGRDVAAAVPAMNAAIAHRGPDGSGHASGPRGH
jgi:asparagine synthetase B (glutamine-hydrolysing)